MTITPDGPTGPRRKAKPGVVRIALEAGVPVVALGMHVSPALRVNSWDRFVVLPPFASVTIHATVVAVPDDTGEATRVRMLTSVEDALNA